MNFIRLIFGKDEYEELNANPNSKWSNDTFKGFIQASFPYSLVDLTEYKGGFCFEFSFGRGYFIFYITSLIKNSIFEFSRAVPAIKFFGLIYSENGIKLITKTIYQLLL